MGRWRKRHGEALLVVDQFEGLFTQNPPEAQARFAELLGRLAEEAGVHVLLSMRDDFLIHCHDHDALAPIFSELTPIKPPAGAVLRRALERLSLGRPRQLPDRSRRGILNDDAIGHLRDPDPASGLRAGSAFSPCASSRPAPSELLDERQILQGDYGGDVLASSPEHDTLPTIGHTVQSVRELVPDLGLADPTRRSVRLRHEMSSWERVVSPCVTC
jgi:hypothetical protein